MRCWARALRFQTSETSKIGIFPDHALPGGGEEGWRNKCAAWLCLSVWQVFTLFRFHFTKRRQFKNLIDICWESWKSLTGVCRIIIKASLDLYLFARYLLSVGKFKFNLILTILAIWWDAAREAREKMNQSNKWENLWRLQIIGSRLTEKLSA